MKTNRLLFFALIGILIFSCSSPKEVPVKKTEPKLSKTDVLRGGTSFENPIVIRVTTERAGIDEEYRWLSNNYPGYSMIRRKQVTHNGKRFDIITIRTRSGQSRDVYFDSTAFAKI